MPGPAGPYLYVGIYLQFDHTCFAKIELLVRGIVYQRIPIMRFHAKTILIIILIASSVLAGFMYGYLTSGTGESPISGPTLKLVFMSAENESSIICQTPDGSVLVIDPATSANAEQIADYLEDHEIDQVVLVISRADEYQLEAAVTLGKEIGLQQIAARQVTEDDFTAALEDYAKGKKINYLPLEPGQVIESSDRTKIEVLGDTKSMQGDIALAIHHDNIDFLLSLHTGLEEEAAITAQMTDLQSNVLAIARGGRGMATSLEWIISTAPEYIIVPVSNTFPPSPDVLERISTKNTGAVLYQTDLNGMVTFITDGKTIETQAEYENIY